MRWFILSANPDWSQLSLVDVCNLIATFWSSLLLDIMLADPWWYMLFAVERVIHGDITTDFSKRLVATTSVISTSDKCHEVSMRFLITGNKAWLLNLYVACFSAAMLLCSERLFWSSNDFRLLPSKMPQMVMIAVLQLEYSALIWKTCC